MSGIACIFHADGRPADPAVIRRMTAAMAYRGPDGIHHWDGPSVGLGQCMMHATAEAPASHQPLASPDGQVRLVMDGYIANYDELRAELQQHGVALRDRSDAELILRAYETWGEACPRHIDGEYAFIAWDARRQAIFCARDHQGLRPLLYHWDGSTFIAASDIAGVLAALPVQPEPDRYFLAEIMAFEPLSTDRTAWQGITRVQQAHWLRVGQDGLHSEPYWTLGTEVTIRYRHDADYIAHYRELLADCVQRAARTHRPLAVEVSGGLDSSAVFAMCDRLERDGRLPAPGFRGYTFLTQPGSAADEIAYARAVASHCGRELSEVPLFLPETGWFAQQGRADRDLPPFANMAMSIGIQQQMAVDGCRVTLNGQGGDHWLESNHLGYNEALRLGDFAAFGRMLRADRQEWGTGRSLAYAARTGLGPFMPPAIRKLRRSLIGTTAQSEERYRLLAPDLRDYLAQGVDRREEWMLSAWHWHYKHRKWLQPMIQRVTESFTRQHARAGIEPRSPMLSRAFIEFSAGTPEHIRRRGAQSRFVHRQAMTGMLPDMVLQRDTKADFGMAYNHHEAGLQSALTPIMHHDPRGLVDPEALQERWSQFCNAAIDERVHWDVWGIYVVMLFYDSATASADASGGDHLELE